MNIHRLASSIIALLMIAGCGSREVSNREAVKTSIRDVLHEQQAAWNDGNSESFVAVYARSDSTRYMGFGEPIYGWETILDRFRTAYPDRAAMGRLEFSDVDITVITEDAALVLGPAKNTCCIWNKIV